MPIYEYKCDSCDHYLEALQKVSEPPLTQCPQCKGSSFRKLVSAAVFKLKGVGWYETDFKDKKPAGKKHQEETKDDVKNKEDISASTQQKQEKQAGNKQKQTDKKLIKRKKLLNSRD